VCVNLGLFFNLFSSLESYLQDGQVSEVLPLLPAPEPRGSSPAFKERTSAILLFFILERMCAIPETRPSRKFFVFFPGVIRFFQITYGSTCVLNIPLLWTPFPSFYSSELSPVPNSSTPFLSEVRSFRRLNRAVICFCNDALYQKVISFAAEDRLFVMKSPAENNTGFIEALPSSILLLFLFFVYSQEYTPTPVGDTPVLVFLFVVFFFFFGVSTF